jgi:hypothetical protein
MKPPRPDSMAPSRVVRTPSTVTTEPSGNARALAIAVGSGAGVGVGVGGDVGVGFGVGVGVDTGVAAGVGVGVGIGVGIGVEPGSGVGLCDGVGAGGGTGGEAALQCGSPCTSQSAALSLVSTRSRPCHRHRSGRPWQRRAGGAAFLKSLGTPHPTDRSPPHRRSGGARRPVNEPAALAASNRVPGASTSGASQPALRVTVEPEAVTSTSSSPARSVEADPWLAISANSSEADAPPVWTSDRTSVDAGQPTSAAHAATGAPSVNSQR